jgi:hypothetical protein
MKNILALSKMRVALEIVLVVLLVPLVLSYSSAPRASVAQAPEAPEASNAPAPEAPEALYWYVCNAPNHIGLFATRVHIYCQSTTPIGGAPALSSSIHWFAYPTAPDSAAASRFMSLLQTSVITSRPVWLMVNPTDTSGSSFGCAAGDCRRISGMEMR